MTREPGRLRKNLALAAVTMLLALAATEAGLRAYAREPNVPLHVVCGDCPYLYGMNPRHRGVSSQGLRDRDFAIPKPASVFRILVLGDSIAYGVGVGPDDTFAKVLERRLGAAARVEVVNSGVMGYTAWNELQYYLARGRAFQPDLVVVAVCMNDVADPELHWSGTRREVASVPADAIPNAERHRRVTSRPGYRLGHLVRGSALLRFVGEALDQMAVDSGRYETVTGRRWPTYVSAEDDLSIRVLTDYDSPEWEWLRSVYDRLDAAVRGDGASLVLLVIPLAYQLEDGYPLRPQEQFRRYCDERRIACIDVGEALGQHRLEGVFHATGMEGGDIWHPTLLGHRLIAGELERWLARRELGARGTAPAP